MDALKAVMFRVHPEGYRFVAIGVVATLLLFTVHPVPGWIGVLATFACAWFFRDPVRIVPKRDGLIVSPADGLVDAVETVSPPDEFDLGDAPMLRISVFMSICDCHVNRVPAAGRIAKIVRRPGRFRNAANPDVAKENERSAVVIERRTGGPLVVVQIAGFVARRIVCFVREGRDVRAGERIGLIRFGSRCDVYLPADLVPLVSVGQTAVAGETVLCDSASSEPLRDVVAT